MARSKTYKNTGGAVQIDFADGRTTLEIGSGGTYTTSDEKEQHALKLSGFTETKGEPKDSKESEK